MDEIILALSDAAKIKMADHIIEEIKKRKGNLGVSTDTNEENELNSVFIDTENMNESCCLNIVLSEAIKAACEVDGIDCSIE